MCLIEIYLFLSSLKNKNPKMSSTDVDYTLFVLKFLLSNKILVIRAGIHKMHVRIANMELFFQNQSDLGLYCLSRPYL